MEDQEKDSGPPGTEAAPFPPAGALLPLSDQLLLDCKVMARHLIASGVSVPAGVIERLGALEESGGPCRELVDVYNRLARMVAPATPRSLVYLAREEWLRGAFDFSARCRWSAA